MTPTEHRFSISLGLKFLAAFALVILVGLVTLSCLANLAAAREVRGFMMRGGTSLSTRLADRLEAYYTGRGSWQGVAPLLENLSEMMPGARARQGNAPALYDAEGNLVFSSAGGAVPRLDAQGRARALSIQSGDTVAGYLVLGTAAAGGSTADLLRGVQRAIWLSAIAASVTALAVGGVLVLGLLRPVRELTQAARAMARGARGQRVVVRSADEIGELAAAFNTMAARIDRADALRREMTADIAHELRNPLTVLRGRTEGMLDGVYPADESNLRGLAAQVDQLERLVEDLRVLALADAGQLPLQPVVVDLERLLQEAVDALQPAEGSSVARLEYTVQATGELRSLLDPARFQQILANLVANAQRYAPADSAIEVRLRGEAAMAQIEILDRGPGIPKGDLENIFERFYRLGADRSRGSGGSGLGLAIARKLAEAMGGTLTAANRPGGGAVFLLSIPLEGAGPTSASR